MAAVTAVAAISAAPGISQDLSIKNIDTSQLRCGNCNSTVKVEVANSGRAISGGYNVFLELKVTPGGGPANSRSFKEQLRGFRVGTQTFTFDRIQVGCSQYAANLEAKVYVVGGNFREGNTRNNNRRISVPIQQRCRGNTGGGSGGGSGSSGGSGGGGGTAGGGGLQADLDAGNARPMTLNWNANGTQRLSFYVRNRGRAGSTATRAKLTVTHPDGHSKSEKVQSMPPVGVNRNQSLRFDLALPQCAPGYRYELKVDHESKVAEANEGNNTASNSLQFRNCPPVGGNGTGGGGTGGGNTGGGSSGGGQATGSPDLLIDQIDTSQLRCGSCESTVKVVVSNRGRDISGGYNVFLELKVVPGGGPANTRTFKEQLRGFRSGTQTFTFDEIEVNCSQYAANIEAKIYVVGGNFREGNTRNNNKRISIPIQQRCR